MTENERRKRLREWIAAQITGHDTVNLPDLADGAVDHFTSDEAFMASLAADILRPVVYQMGAQVLSATRHEAVINLGTDEVVTKSEFERRAEQVANRWTRWMEHNGSDYKQFMHLTKADLNEAASRREKRAQTELEIARFERRVAGSLAEDEVVEDQFTPDELETIWDEVNGEGEAA